MAPSLDDFDTKLSTTYDAALRSGHLIFTASEIFLSRETEYGIECQLTYAPLLAKKPQGVITAIETDPRPKFDRPSTPVIKQAASVNPFMPHDPKLYVADAGDEHKVLLNKFCIVPRHFLIITKEFQPQTNPLTPDDLLAVWNTLMALRNSKDAVAFFNCGSRAGASQAHKHMQVIPLEKPSPIAALVREFSKRQPGKKENRPGDVFSVPINCINHVILLPDVSKTNKTQEDILLEAYITLMDAMLISIREYSEQTSLSETESAIAANMTSSMAYNWILTTEFMLIAPRKQEHSESVNGVALNINSLGFAGMVLAKTPEEMELVKSKGVLHVVAETGFSCGWGNRSVEEEQKRREQQDALEKQMGSALSGL
ncbi:hypothetical protein BC939DRAFT_271581 [Gamsiella multidivaricata]|uniref:uncharacterized protein n=1 Tax=Gamsiella multidivaricata TaxID=101098 RepID=UPI0022211041|nr:uncharacterized protein BC939DRAFT_271581 [Gamsiella multidivaricata]KAG0367994.1 bifunctional AP-4-A phosphorylase/ADP sulfurylase [Gamsiella multidivaricata]KAI7819082.1 hypothetical protein BC939DRAFT_271581 [Gamsiella multidivaricata]